MAMDVVSIFNELYAQLVGFRRRMVAHRLEPRRLELRGERQLDAGAMRSRNEFVHFVLSIQRRNSAHNR